MGKNEPKPPTDYSFRTLVKTVDNVDSSANILFKFLQGGIHLNHFPYAKDEERINGAALLQKLEENLSELCQVVRNARLAVSGSSEETKRDKEKNSRRGTALFRWIGLRRRQKEDQKVWVKVPSEDKVSTLDLQMNAVKQGWLTKCGGSHQTWRRRFFILANDKLYYFKSHQDVEPVGVIPLEASVTVMPLSKSEIGKNHGFQILHPKRRAYLMYAADESSRRNWVSAVQAQVIQLTEMVDKAILQEESQALYRSSSNSQIHAEMDSESTAVLGSGAEPVEEIPSAASSDNRLSTQLRFSVEDFELLKVLGRGTYGKVIQARHRRSGTIYAIKIIKKSSLKEEIEAEHTKAEIDVLRRLDHPYLVCLRCSFQTPDRLYLVMDFVAGGDMYSLLHGQPIREELAKFFTAELILAMDYLHSKDIIYRDLKTENILIDSDGHIRLTDFGLVKEGMDLTARTSTICGTADTMAREVVLGEPYGRPVDWWGIGCLLYEMLAGQPPFYSADIEEQFDNIVRGEVSYPKTVSKTAQNLISKLLDLDPDRRLGSGPEGAGKIKSHPFFSTIDWAKMEERKLPPPGEFKPEIRNELDTSNFDPEFTTQSTSNSVITTSELATAAQMDFKGFTFVDSSMLHGQSPSHPKH